MKDEITRIGMAATSLDEKASGLSVGLPSGLECEDLGSLFEIRKYFEDLLNNQPNVEITDAGIGMGYADLGFELEGHPFSLSIKPRRI